MSVDRTKQIAAAALLIAAVGFNVCLLLPEITIGRYDVNDGVLHYAVIARMSEALSSGLDPLDCWHPVTTLGYPFHHTYPPLGHAAVLLLHRLFLGAVELLTLFCWVRYLLLCLYPLAVYRGARWMGFSGLAAASSAVLCSLVATQERGYYGLEFGSYIWRGSGLYAQEWAMVILPLAVGAICRATREGKGWPAAGLLLGLTYLSHVIYGYIASISALLLLLFGPDRGRRGIRLSGVFTLTLVFITFFILPFLLDGEAINHSRWEESWKWDSFGHKEILSSLFTGKIFDRGATSRFGILSLLVGVGAVLAALRGKEPARFCLAGLLLWLLLFFGRSTWGVLVDLLPLSGDLPFHRLIGGVHFFGLLLAGWVLGMGLEFLLRREQRLAAGVLTLLVLLPLWHERFAYLEQGVEWGQENRVAYLEESSEVDEVLEQIGSEETGRVYPGRAATWGGKFRVGRTPLYGVLTRHSVDCLSFLYHAMSLSSDLMVEFDDARRAQYSLFHVSWVLTDDPDRAAPFLRTAGEFGRFRLYRAPGGDVFQPLRSDVTYRGGRGDLYEIGKKWMASRLLERGQCVEIVPEDADVQGALSSGEPLPPPASLPGGAPGEVLTVEVEGDTYRSRVEFRESGVLLFKMTYHPRWRVTVDGEAAEAILLVPGFCGVRLEPGTHSVAFTYAPPGWRVPIQWLGLLLLAASFLLARGGHLRRLEDFLHARWVACWEFGRRGLSRLRLERSERFALIALGAICLAASLPLFQPRMHDTHDVLAYVPRVVEFHENVRQGVLVPRWAPDLSAGRGEPLFLFSPPLLYIVAEGFLLLGAGPIVATHLACFTGVLLAGVGIYMLGRVFGGPWGGLLAAGAYLFAPYFLVDLYVRGAYAEFIAFAAYPWALLGLWRMAHGGKGGATVLAAGGVAAVMLSHNGAALIFVPFAAFWVSLLAWKERKISFLFRGGGAIALGLALAAYFWVPAIAERSEVWVERLRGEYLDYRLHFVILHQFVTSRWGYGLSVWGPGDGMSFALGWTQIAIAFSVLLLWVWRRKKVRGVGLPLTALLAGVVAGVFFTNQVSLFLWKSIHLLQYLGFPWRFLTLVTLCLAVLASFLPALIPKGRAKQVICAAALLLLVGSQIGHAGPKGFLQKGDRNYTPARIAREGIETTTMREYEPRSVEKVLPYSPFRGRFLDGEGQVKVSSWAPEVRLLDVVRESPGTLRVELSHFPGWEVRLDGEVVDHHVEEGGGRILVDVPPGRHDLVVRFRSTPIRLLAGWISILALLVQVIWWSGAGARLAGAVTSGRGSSGAGRSPRRG